MAPILLNVQPIPSTIRCTQNKGCCRVTSTPARKEITRTACGHTWKENTKARSAIEDASMKKVGNRQHRQEKK